jgi:hypothetical protein
MLIVIVLTSRDIGLIMFVPLIHIDFTIHNPIVRSKCMDQSFFEVNLLNPAERRNSTSAAKTY